MQESNNINHTIKFNNDLLNRLRGSRKIDIYLIEAEVSKYKTYMNSYVCNNVYIKTENSLFCIVGVVEDFGIEKDEVFALSIKEGWLNFQTRFEGDNIIVDFKELTLNIEKSNFAGLIHFYSLKSNDNLSIDVKSSIEELNTSISDTSENVEVDEGLILKDNCKSIYIGQHVFPFSIIVTMDELLVKELLCK